MLQAAPLLLLVLLSFSPVHATIARCQQNCSLTEHRLYGPTKPAHTRPHPWFEADFPFQFLGFCQLGCQLFFSETPNNVTCKSACDYAYRYRVTVEYSDLGEIARLECRDGCDIALDTCQTGYYCTEGSMTPCPPGRFRESGTEDVHTCIDCPVGRYRKRNKGIHADTCDLCPIGKYSNVTGATEVQSCERCPAGMVAEEEGMALCKCITPGSCALQVQYGWREVGDTEEFFSNGVDFFRETVPYIGRW